jgi:hypothetical protein
MSKMKWIALVAVLAALGFSLGCESDSNDNNNTGGGGGGASGSYAGIWTGNVCGRGLTMVLSQNGTSLSGTYTFSDPTFSDTCAGSLASEDAPTTARLNSTGGHDWWFELSFGSYNQFSGGFYKAEKGGKVCDVNATK